MHYKYEISIALDFVYTIWNIIDLLSYMRSWEGNLPLHLFMSLGSKSYYVCEEVRYSVLQSLNIFNVQRG